MDKLDQYEWKGEGTPDFDHELAETYIGKYILVGITYQDCAGNFLEHVQMHGVISSASPQGILITLKGTREGESWNMPPMQEAIQPANPGAYRLKNTNETIEDPDFLVTWTVTKPPVQ